MYFLFMEVFGAHAPFVVSLTTNFANYFEQVLVTTFRNKFALLTVAVGDCPVSLPTLPNRCINTLQRSEQRD